MTLSGKTYSFTFEFLCIFVLFNVLFHFEFVSCQNVKNNKITCSGNPCPASAGAIINSVEFGVNPCDDFYSFACGRWPIQNQRPAKNAQWNTFISLGEKRKSLIQDTLLHTVDTKDIPALREAKSLFVSCLHGERTGTAQLAETLDLQGSRMWPLLLNGKWYAKHGQTFDWFKFIADVRREFGLGFLIDVDVSYDVTSSSSYAVYIDQGDLYIASPNFLNNGSMTRHIVQKYKELITTIAVEIGNSLKLPLNLKNIEKSTEDLIRFEMNIGSLMPKENERLKRGIEVYRLRQFQAFMNQFSDSDPEKQDWKDFLARVFQSSKVRVAENEKLIVLNSDYLFNTIQEIKYTSKETVANYLIWRLIASYATLTSPQIRQAVYDFQNFISGATGPNSRENTCATLVTNIYTLAVTPQLLKKTFNRSQRQEVNEIATKIKASLTDLMQRSVRLDYRTKSLVLSKMRGMIDCIGYPDWLENSTLVQSYFSDLKVQRMDPNFIRKILQGLHWKSDNQLKKLRSTFVKTCEWETGRLLNDFLPFYQGTRNSINFPMAFLQSPVYINDGPLAFKYGGLGTTLGHEIAHAIPSEGWLKDSDGQTTRIAECLIDEYNKLEDGVLSSPRQSKDTRQNEFTLSENFPDNVGLQAAYRAFRQTQSSRSPRASSERQSEDFSVDQLFFLAFAHNFCEGSTKEIMQFQLQSDPHTLSKFRVIGTLRNFQPFAEAWQCPLGSRMNPTRRKCDVF